MTQSFKMNHYMEIRKVLPILLFVFTFTSLSKVNAQTDTTALSLAQALDYAMSNNSEVKNSYANLEIANQTVKEVTAIGLPQVSGNVAFQNAIEKQVFIFPLNNVPTAVRVGNRYTTQASLNFSWLLLDGTYFLGLKSA